MKNWKKKKKRKEKKRKIKEINVPARKRQTTK